MSSFTLEQKRFAETVENVESKLRKKAIFVPTLDEDVKLQLRACGEPICLFGEGPADRRERLRAVLDVKSFADEDVAIQRQVLGLKKHGSEEDENPKEVVYERAGKELIAVRRYIYDYSMEKCKNRLEKQREEDLNMDLLAENEKNVKKLWDQYSNLFVESSQFGSARPLSCCRVNNTNPSIPSCFLLTGCFGGEMRLWNLDDSSQLYSWKGHTDRICSVSWSPLSQLSIQGNKEITGQSHSPAFASASLDKTAKIWGFENNAPVLLQTLTGHLGRVSTVAFHPSGRYCGTVSFDTSFRFWDVETGKQLFLQDGHAREVYGLDFQCDGSLAATTDESGVCRIWDLRSGRCISTLSGHVKGMISCCFSPIGFQFATAGDDNTVKIWDLRKQKSIYTIPASNSVIPDVRYDSTGEFLATCSFDHSVRVWSTRNYKCLKNLDGHDSRVSGIDFLTNKVGIVSCSHDKTWKKWLCDALLIYSAVRPFLNLGLLVYFGERKTAVLFLNTPDIVKVRSQTNEYCCDLNNVLKYDQPLHMRCQKKEKNEVYKSTELYRIPVESSGLSNNPSNDANHNNPILMDGRNDVVFLPPTCIDGSYPYVQWNSYYGPALAPMVSLNPMNYTNEPLCNNIIPPPPLYPIYNPIVYNNNIDVGSYDFNYISDNSFALLNAHQPSFCFPRISVPVESKTPRELIPSLLPQADMMIPSFCDTDTSHSESPLNGYHAEMTDSNINLKVNIVGFSWFSSDEVCEGIDDVWVRKE